MLPGASPKSILTAVQAGSLEILERAQLPPQQARAIVQAIELEIAGAKDTLATKSDLLLLGSELRSEMSGLRSELRSELRSGMSELRAEMHGMASSITRQMYGALLGQMAVLLGIAYFFVSHISISR